MEQRFRIAFGLLFFLFFLFLKGAVKVDEMNIQTKFMRSIFARLIAKGLKKGLGIDIDLDLTSLNVSFDGEKGRICLTANATMDKAEIGKLVKNI